MAADRGWEGAGCDDVLADGEEAVGPWRLAAGDEGGWDGGVFGGDG